MENEDLEIEDENPEYVFEKNANTTTCPFCFGCSCDFCLT
jgi:hypothetical protein